MLISKLFIPEKR